MEQDMISMEDFLKEYPVTMACTHKGTRDEEYTDGQGKKCTNTQDSWACRLEYKGRDITIDFHMGLAHRKLNPMKFRSVVGGPPTANDRANAQYKFRPERWVAVSDPIPPKVGDVLDCLSSDSSSYDDARDFEDWATNFGYDTDSRKADKIYQTCGEQSKALKYFLGKDLYEKLLYSVERL